MAFRKKQSANETELYEYAIGALGRRMRSVAELKRLMRNRVPRDAAGQQMLENVVLRLKEQKYLNDTSYASIYSAYRRDNEKFGRRRVITDLKLKGVHADVIEKAVMEAYSGVDEAALARDFLKRKRIGKPANDREAARTFRALLRAGFSSGVAIKTLKAWKVEDEVLTALQEEAEAEG